MVKLTEDNSPNELKLKFPNAEKFYKFEDDNKTIGMASINNDEQNKFYIFIKENLRGRGYGKLLFSEIMKELNSQNYIEVKVNCNTNNIQMRKILDSNGAIPIAQMERTFKYKVPVK